MKIAESESPSLKRLLQKTDVVRCQPTRGKETNTQINCQYAPWEPTCQETDTTGNIPNNSSVVWSVDPFKRGISLMRATHFLAKRDDARESNPHADTERDQEDRFWGRFHPYEPTRGFD